MAGVEDLGGQKLLPKCEPSERYNLPSGKRTVFTNLDSRDSDPASDGSELGEPYSTMLYYTEASSCVLSRESLLLKPELLGTIFRSQSLNLVC